MHSSTRTLSRDDAKTLSPGDNHYSAYVGPPALYDLMGASQFRLLTTLGLRETQRPAPSGAATPSGDTSKKPG